MMLGSGELGKEVVIALKRMGCTVVACDAYAGAPAMQVANDYEVINMLDGDALDDIVAKHEPDIIVPEVESIRTENFFKYEKQGYKVVPSAKAANFTMNRKAIRDLAFEDLNIKTAKYQYATSYEELEASVSFCGMPCVVKPLMSSSGKGQSVIKTPSDIQKAWNYALEGSRGDLLEVIVEGFIDFEYEITLLTVTQKNSSTLFCPPIGHRQERGDYQESWQPMPMDKERLEEACNHTSQREQLATKAERESIKFMQVKFMEDKVGQKFDGIISGITERGIYVEIISNKCEGMIAARDMSGDHFYFDEQQHAMIGQKTNQTFTLGDPISIVVKSANLSKKQLDFVLPSNN